MTTRVQTIIERLGAIQHEAQDLSDTLSEWGLDEHAMAKIIKGNLGVIGTLAEQSCAVADAEQNRYPLEEAASPRRGDFIITRSGIRFWPLDPKPEEVLPEDVAWALSMTCRFGRHPRRFYSVAEHSLQVAYLAEMRAGPAVRPYALLHDAHEAYLADVVRPVARHLRGWLAIEAAMQDAVAAAFGLPPISPELEEVLAWADDAALVLEVRELFPEARELWADDPHLPKVDLTDAALNDPTYFEHDPIAGPREVLLPALQAIWRRAREAETAAAQAAAEQGTDPEPSSSSWRDELKVTVEPVEWCKVCEMDGRRVKAVASGLCGDCAPF